MRFSQHFAEFPGSLNLLGRPHNTAMPQRDSNASKGTHRLRKGRKSLEQQVYHVTTATNNRGSMKSQVATSLKKRLPIHGEIWQRGFHDHAIRRDENLVSVARYLVANPLRAGLVTEIGDYPHWDSIWI